MLIRKSIYHTTVPGQIYIRRSKTVGKTVEGRRKKTWVENNSEYSNPVPERTVALRRGNDGPISSLNFFSLIFSLVKKFSLNFTQPEKQAGLLILYGSLRVHLLMMIKLDIFKINKLSCRHCTIGKDF